MICDVCGNDILDDKYSKCHSCNLVVCNKCVHTCNECGDMLCCNSGEFNHNLCKSCEEKYYIDFVEV